MAGLVNSARNFVFAVLLPVGLMCAVPAAVAAEASDLDKAAAALIRRSITDSKKTGDAARQTIASLLLADARDPTLKVVDIAALVKGDKVLAEAGVTAADIAAAIAAAEEEAKKIPDLGVASALDEAGKVAAAENQIADANNGLPDTRNIQTAATGAGAGAGGADGGAGGGQTGPVTGIGSSTPQSGPVVTVSNTYTQNTITRRTAVSNH